MIKIAPSILSADFSKLGEEVKKVEEAGAEYLHLDVMDGKFVPNITIGIPVIKSIRANTNLVFDVHLMIEEPDKYLKDFAEAGADIITVHQEACVHIHRTLQAIHEIGVKSGIALNPGTSLETLKYILDDVDMILIMCVNPGYGSQQLISSMLNKIKETKELLKYTGHDDIDIEVDGGINLKNVDQIVKAGANVIVSGSAIFYSNDIKETINDFKRAGAK